MQRHQALQPAQPQQQRRPVDFTDAASTSPLPLTAPTILRRGRRLSELLHASPAPSLAPPTSSPSSSSTLTDPPSPTAWDLGTMDDSQSSGRPCNVAGCEHLARTRGLCPVHGGGSRCKMPDCAKHAVSGGRCVSHGGGRRCSITECANNAVSRRLCVQHGGGRKCKYDGCTKHVASGGLCRAHGGGRRCKVPDCLSSAQSRGLCYVHGGGGRCQQPGCASSAKKGGLCIAHGGGHRCQVRGCSSSAVSGDLCRAHGGGKRCAVADCKSSAKTGGRCIAHGGGKRCTVVGCKSSAQRLGRCKAHGGGRKCTALGCANSAVSRGKCIGHGGGKRCVFAGCSTTARRGGYCFAHGGHARASATASTAATPSPDTSFLATGDDTALSAKTMKRNASTPLVDSVGRQSDATKLLPSLLTPKPMTTAATMVVMTPPLAPIRPRLPSMSLLLSTKLDGVRGAEHTAAIPPIRCTIPPRRYSSDTDDADTTMKRHCNLVAAPASEQGMPSPKTPGYSWRRLQETVRLESKAQGLVEEDGSDTDGSEEEEEDTEAFSCSGSRKSGHMGVMCA